jgi:hypothetical protein
MLTQRMPHTPELVTTSAYARFGSIACSLVAALVFLLLCACSGLVPILDIENAPVIVPSGETATVDAVRDAAMRALATNGWHVHRERPGEILAIKVYGVHSARIALAYNPKTFSIEYVESSPGLKSNGRMIHARYNEWIEPLDRSIRENLLVSSGIRSGAAGR